MEELKELARQQMVFSGDTPDEILISAGLEWAVQLLLRYTMGRVKQPAEESPPPAALVNCTAELAMLWIREQQRSGRTVVRESVGSWSRTWSAGSASLQRQSVQVITLWLGGMDGLLYRGVD